MLNSELLMNVGLDHYLILSVALFSIGAFGVLVRRNVIVIMMSIELMLNAVNIAFIAFSHFSANIEGQIMVFFVMPVAAAEAGVGLVLAVMIFKRFKEINIYSFEHLKG